MSEIIPIEASIRALKEELHYGILSLDDDEQIPAVVIMRLALKRIEDIERTLETKP